MVKIGGIAITPSLQTVLNRDNETITDILFKYPAAIKLYDGDGTLKDNLHVRPDYDLEEVIDTVKYIVFGTTPVMQLTANGVILSKGGSLNHQSLASTNFIGFDSVNDGSFYDIRALYYSADENKIAYNDKDINVRHLKSMEDYNNHIRFILQTLYAFQNSISGSASISNESTDLKLSTGTTAGSVAQSLYNKAFTYFSPSWDNKRTLEFICYGFVETDKEARMGIGSLVTLDGVYFKISGGDLYGCIQAGGTEYTLLLQSALSSPTHSYKIVTNGKNSADFYLDGVLKGTVINSSGSMTGSETIFAAFRVDNLSSATDGNIEMAMFDFEEVSI